MILALMNHDSKIAILGICLVSSFKIVAMIGNTRNPNTILTNAMNFFSLLLMVAPSFRLFEFLYETRLTASSAISLSIVS